MGNAQWFHADSFVRTANLRRPDGGGREPGQQMAQMTETMEALLAPELPTTIILLAEICH